MIGTSTVAAPAPALEFDTFLEQARQLVADRESLPEVFQSDLAPLDLAYLTTIEWHGPATLLARNPPTRRPKLMIHPRLLARVLKWTDAELDALPPGWQLEESVPAQIAGLPVHMTWHMNWRRALSPIERLRADQVCTARHARIAAEKQA